MLSSISTRKIATKILAENTTFCLFYGAVTVRKVVIFADI